MDKTFKQRLEILPIKNIEHPVGNTKYYAAVHVKSLISQADEEYQELFDKYSNLNDSYEKEVIRSSKIESQIIDLKSQLQQQALPAVPEFVGLGISEDIQLNTVVADVLTTVITSDDKDLKEYGLWIKEKPVTYVIARTLGYTIEKPQLFYLKHIDMSRVDETHDWFIIRHGNLGHSPFCKGELPYYCNNAKYTQKEIDSMQTGSYEQIEVAE